MTTRFTCTITTTANDGATRAAETEKIANALLKVAAMVQSTRATTGTITDSNGVASATYTYTPTANV